MHAPKSIGDSAIDCIIVQQQRAQITQIADPMRNRTLQTVALGKQELKALHTPDLGREHARELVVLHMEACESIQQGDSIGQTPKEALVSKLMGQIQQTKRREVPDLREHFSGEK
jgi:hypothetical protein